MKALKPAIVFIIILILVMIAIYLIKFGFTDSREDWGTFGDYLSGIFAMFNLGVVILLTFYIARLDKDRSERELEAQRRIMISQLRFSQITELEEIFNGLIDMKNLSTMDDFKHTLVVSHNQILNFRHGKLHLFPNLREYQYDDKITDILNFFDKYLQDEFYEKTPIDLRLYRDDWFKKIHIKDELLTLLYNYTIDKLNMRDLVL